jgi:folate-dependent phosphoribosylglycinamide formyltransferase PurN/SAM-dependent methyltransferase
MATQTNSKRILILSGDSASAVRAANLYFKHLSPLYDIQLVEEKSLTLQRLTLFLKRRFLKKGFFSVIDSIMLRVSQLLGKKHKPEEKRYPITQLVQSINSPQVIQLIRQWEPDLIITNACSLLKKELINASPCRILNLHNGITPRYRGTGNFWAIYENNPSLTGVTIHYIDAGIDTGERIAVEPIDFVGQNIPFEELDIHAFDIGAQLIIRYLKGETISVPDAYLNLTDGLYSFPGLLAYRQAKKRYQNLCQENSALERTWQESFKSLSMDNQKTIYQKMHWHDDTTVPIRDNWIKMLYDKIQQEHWQVLDVGCGDGRYKHLLGCRQYTGCDYSLETMALGGDESNLVHCPAEELPFANAQFHCTLAIGLFQHLSCSQKAADELHRVTATDGYIIINTLRQFSILELLVMLPLSLGKPDQLRLVLAVLQRDYFRGRVIGGTLVARRFTKQEILEHFRLPKKNFSFYYNGFAGSALFAREITIVIRNQHKKRKNSAHPTGTLVGHAN